MLLNLVCFTYFGVFCFHKIRAVLLNKVYVLATAVALHAIWPAKIWNYFISLILGLILASYNVCEGVEATARWEVVVGLLAIEWQRLTNEDWSVAESDVVNNELMTPLTGELWAASTVVNGHVASLSACRILSVSWFPESPVISPLYMLLCWHFISIVWG